MKTLAKHFGLAVRP